MAKGRNNQTKLKTRTKLARKVRFTQYISDQIKRSRENPHVEVWVSSFGKRERIIAADVYDEAIHGPYLTDGYYTEEVYIGYKGRIVRASITYKDGCTVWFGGIYGADNPQRKCDFPPAHPGNPNIVAYVMESKNQEETGAKSKEKAP